MFEYYKRILIAVDGSDEAYAAFRKAVAIANRNDAELLLLHVIELVPLGSHQTLSSSAVEAEKKEAESMLNEYVTYAEERGLTKVKTIIDTGPPKQIITRILPEEYEIDLTIVGATGLGAMERYIIGSVSENVTHYSPNDVLITRKK